MAGWELIGCRQSAIGALAIGKQPQLTHLRQQIPTPPPVAMRYMYVLVAYV